MNPFTETLGLGATLSMRLIERQARGGDQLRGRIELSLPEPLQAESLTVTLLAQQRLAGLGVQRGRVTVSTRNEGTSVNTGVFVLPSASMTRATFDHTAAHVARSAADAPARERVTGSTSFWSSGLGVGTVTATAGRFTHPLKLGS